ncbi:hypothetical protein VNI00_002741 [Paramarasmius palmivorus]|uniref:Zinc finger Mcm10/DnaG-type domain-containing protein n=1 Tax=Paramarasmius palmivorus TaxID=297713 RepID=A0AAW0DUZ1_9AGAR
MESIHQKSERDKQEQAEIRRQIAQLQARLKDDPEEQDTTHGSPKRKHRESTLLAPATPSPKKKKAESHIARQPHAKTVAARTNPDSASLTEPPIPVKPVASNLLEKLAGLRDKSQEERPPRHNRTNGFTERPPEQDMPIPDNPCTGTKRDDRLAIIEDLQPGPVEHTPSFDDPNFDALEPNSGIRLSSRTLPHEDLQDYLRGRFYLSPSRLYSSVRLLPDKQGYDVPVPGDWVTIAVVAERGPIKHTSTPVGINKNEEDNEEENAKSSKQGKGSVKGTEKGSNAIKGKKYINFKLIDFGSRSGGSSSGGKSVIRGDAFLSLLLFEADSYDVITREGSKRQEKIYKGGSRGAFEAMTKLKEGDVVALLNPKVLKPYQRRTDNPHPVDNILAITPESAASITTIGRAKDLGMCTAIKRDGKVCGSWCDKRVSNVCDFHVQSAIDSRRASRPEFSAGTSGLGSVAAKAKRKNDYDPRRQWGLQPNSQQDQSEDVGSTYVFSGHIIKGSSNDPDRFSRERQTREQKKLAALESERALEKLLKRDKEGMQSVMKARQVLGATKRKKESGKEEPNSTDTPVDDAEELDEEHVRKKRKSLSAFQVMKLTGFDPISAKHGEPRQATEDVKKKMEELASIHQARKTADIQRIAGPRKRSGVVAPVKQQPTVEDRMVDLDSD